MSNAPAVAVFLGLGSNLGDRRHHLIQALDLLGPGVHVEAVSSLYETDPVGPPDQQEFYNAVCHGTTLLSPSALLAHVKRIEQDIGRKERERWGPREIDIDILLYGGSEIDEADLVIPHPELRNRAFVLVPLAELAGELRLPGDGRAIAELASEQDDTGVRLLEGVGWEVPRPR